jgi:predicted transcriptional regulator
MTSSRTSSPRGESLAKQLEIRIGPAGDALDRFEAAWNRVAEGRSIRTLHVLTLGNLPLLLKMLSPARFELLQKLRETGPLSIYELAKRLERNYKNVYTDVTQLAALGLIERASDNRITVPWEVLRAELSL